MPVASGMSGSSRDDTGVCWSATIAANWLAARAAGVVDADALRPAVCAATAKQNFKLSTRSGARAHCATTRSTFTPPRVILWHHCRAADWKEQVWVGKLQVVTRDRVGEAAVKLVNPETGKVRRA